MTIPNIATFDHGTCKLDVFFVDGLYWTCRPCGFSGSTCACGSFLLAPKGQAARSGKDISVLFLMVLLKPMSTTYYGTKPQLRPRDTQETNSFMCWGDFVFFVEVCNYLH